MADRRNCRAATGWTSCLRFTMENKCVRCKEQKLRGFIPVRAANVARQVKASARVFETEVADYLQEQTLPFSSRTSATVRRANQQISTDQQISTGSSRYQRIETAYRAKIQLRYQQIKRYQLRSTDIQQINRYQQNPYRYQQINKYQQINRYQQIKRYQQISQISTDPADINRSTDQHKISVPIP